MSDCSMQVFKPKACPHESSVVDGKKSYCEPWERWTNCREVGYCVRESMGGGKSGPVQLSLL